MSWIRVEPYKDGLGPDYETPSLPWNEVLVFDQFADPSGGTPQYLSRLTRYSAKWPTSSGLESGVVLPTNWHRGIMKVSTVQPYSYFVRQHATRHWYRKNWGSDSRVQCVPNYALPGWDRENKTLSVGSDLLNKAKTKCMEAIAQSKFDASEFVAGAVQTVTMLRSILITLAEVLVEIHRYKYLRAARLLGRKLPRSPKDAADAWLQLQYGIRPLVSDASALIEKLKEQLASGELLLKSTGTQTEPLTDSQVFGTRPIGQTIPFVVTSNNSKRSAKVECVYRISDTAAKAYASVNFTNPFYLGWVATPYSFLVDWLVPVGDWLNGMGAALGCEFHSAWITQRLQVDAEAHGPNVNVTGGSFGLSFHKPVQLPKTRYEVMVIQRNVLGTWPRPELYVNRSPFRSSTRLANALALAVSSSSRAVR